MPDLWMGIKMLNILVSRLQFPVFNQLNSTLVHMWMGPGTGQPEVDSTSTWLQRTWGGQGTVMEEDCPRKEMLEARVPGASLGMRWSCHGYPGYKGYAPLWFMQLFQFGRSSSKRTQSSWLPSWRCTGGDENKQHKCKSNWQSERWCMLQVNHGTN